MSGPARADGRWIRALLALGFASAIIVAGVAWRTGSNAIASPRVDHGHTIVLDDVGRLLLGHHDGVLASADGGRNWTTLLVGWDVMAAAPGPADAILVAGHGFVGSVDRQGSLTRLDDRLTDRDVHALSIDPVTGDTWIATASGTVLRSKDEGSTWDVVFAGPIALLAASGEGLIGIDPFEGLVASPDGRSWARFGALPTSPVSSLDVAGGSGAIAVTGPAGAWVSRDGGAAWSMVSQDPAQAAVFLHADEALLVLGKDGALHEAQLPALQPDHP